MSEPNWEELSLQELGDALWSRAYQQGKNVGFRDGYQDAIANLKTEAGLAFAQERDEEAKTYRKIAKMLATAAPSLEDLRARNEERNDYPIRVELARRDGERQEQEQEEMAG